MFKEPVFVTRPAMPSLEEFNEYLSKIWDSKVLTNNGPFHKELEERLVDFLGVDYLSLFNNGTSALLTALQSMELEGEVITTPYTFVATTHALVWNNLKPVFVDIEPETLCIDPYEIQKSITTKTTAILPVHFGGFPCNLKDIQDIAEKHNLTIIEDAAHASGATYNNKKIGSHGTAVCFSFHPVKNLAMPTGGLISINHKNHKQFRKILLARRWCGITDRIDSEYDVKELGWNYYMNEFSAVIGLAQLKKLDRLNNVRKNIAKFYDKQIDVEHKTAFSKDCSYHLYWILVKNRKKFRERMEQVGIETGTHYKPIHTMKMYQNHSILPNTENIGKQIVTIPIHPNLKTFEIDKIVNSINKFI